MTVSTSTWLTSKDYAHLALCLQFEGIDLIFTTSEDTSGLATAWSSATSAKWATVYSGLEVSGTITQQIRRFDAQIKPTSLTFTINDTTDALAQMFADADPSVVTTKITSTAAADDATIYGDDVSGFAALGGIAHCGTESFQYLAAGGGAFTFCTRGYRSLYQTSTGGGMGTLHEVDPQTNARPSITDQPRAWINRGVALYACHQDPTGTWSAGTDAQLLWTGRIKTYADDGMGRVVLSCQDVLELLQGTLMARPYQGNLAEGTYVAPRDAGIIVAVTTANLSTGAITSYTVISGTLSVASSQASHQQIASSINDLLTQWFTGSPGTYGPSGAGLGLALMDAAGSLRYAFTLNDPAAAGTDAYTALVKLSPKVLRMLGFEQQAAAALQTVPSGNTIYGTVDVSSGEVLTAPAVARAYAALEPYKYAAALNDIILLDVLTVTDVVAGTTFYPQPTLPDRFAHADGQGFLLIGGKQLLLVKQLTSTTFRLLDDATWLIDGGPRKQSYGDLTSVRDDFSGAKVEVRQGWYETGTLGKLLLQVLASTGAAAYNHPDYDVYPAQMGLGIPWSLLNSSTILGLGGSPAPPYALIVTKPTPVIKLLESALNFTGSHLTFQAGQIASVVPSDGWSGNAISLTESNKAKQVTDKAREPVLERMTCDRNTDGIVNRVTLRYQASLDGNFRNTLSVNAVDSQTDFAQVKAAVIDGYGIYTDAEVLPGGSVETWVNQVAVNALKYFSRPLAVAERSYDFSLWPQLYAGAQVAIDDNYLIDPATGTRGVIGLLAWVSACSFDTRSGVGKVQVAFAPSQSSARQARYAPSAKVDETNSTGGFSAGYKSGTKELAVKDHEYSSTDEAKDITHFAVGDKIHVVQLGAAAGLDWADTIASKDDTTGILTMTTGLAGWSSSHEYVVEFDDIATVVISQRAAYAYLSSAGTTGYAADDARRWTGAPSTAPTESFSYQTRYRKPQTAGQATGEPLSVHKLADVARWLNTAAIYHTSPIYVNEQFPEIAVAFGSQPVIYGPVLIPLYGGNARKLDIRVLAKMSAAAKQGIWRFVTGVHLPQGQNNIDFESTHYPDITASSLNWKDIIQSPGTTWTWLSSTIAVPSIQPGGPGTCWLTLETVTQETGETIYTKGIYVAEYPEDIS